LIWKNLSSLTIGRVVQGHLQLEYLTKVVEIPRHLLNYFSGAVVGIKSKNISIIDQEATVEGTFSCKGRLIIKGAVKGTLLGDIVTIAKEGAVHADVKAVSITIGGIFAGEIKGADKLIILSTGNCSGKVLCKDLVVEAGGILNAEVNCNKIIDSNKPSENSPLSQPRQTVNPKHKIQN